jgi:hypothetical protein
MPSTCYVTLHRLIWRFVNSKFLFGYFNFILISIPGLTFSILLIVLGGVLFRGAAIFPNTNFAFVGIMSKIFSLNSLVIYYTGTLPMAFFWFIGVLTAWKFSKKQFSQ